jgi:small-conductance mechanosensitive channel
VEEGVPFCPHCSAPQIRVVIAEPAPPPLAFAAATTSQDAAVLPASQTVPVLALPMQWSQALKPCALAAVIAFLLGLLSQSVTVAMLAAGFLAVIFHGRRRSGIPLRASQAAKLGALAGILCSGILSMLMAFAVTVPDARSKMQDQCIENAQKFAKWFPANPNIQASIDQLKTPEGFVRALIEACVILCLLSIALAGLGGILGGAILGRRDRS